MLAVLHSINKQEDRQDGDTGEWYQKADLQQKNND